jgi:hypothetical protein
VSGQLHRLAAFQASELVRILYRRTDGPNPGTKARAREVQELTRTALQDALVALEGGAECVGTSGYEMREDTISVDVARENGALWT